MTDEIEVAQPEEDNVLRFAVKITATGEVHDKDGNLLSSQPYETTVIVTESELLAMFGEEEDG